MQPGGLLGSEPHDWRHHHGRVQQCRPELVGNVVGEHPVHGRPRASSAPNQHAKMGRMEQRVSLITLGVADLNGARAFYEKLGWVTGAEPDADVAFFQAGGSVVALWDRGKLAQDSGVQDAHGWGGVTLAYCADSPGAVDAVLAEALSAGATITRTAGETFWGGYSGVFVDPAGHPWEVAHNPHWTLHDDGSVSLARASTVPASCP
jgi:uncharacterized protein